MNAAQIITADAQRQGVDPETALRVVHGMIHRRHATLMQEHNSVLVAIPIGHSAMELHLFTVDSPLTLMASIKMFYQHLQDAGIHLVYGKADNPGIIALLRRIGPVEASNLPKYNWMARI